MGDLSTAVTAPVAADTDAADRLAAQVAGAPGQMDVVCIAPLTNTALAARRSPGSARDVRHLWVMDGRWDGAVAGAGRLEAEHDLRSDAVAAVLGCGAPTTVTGPEVTQQVHLGPAEVAAITAAGAAGAVLAPRTEQRVRLWGQAWDVPHDPVATLAMLRPDLVPTGDAGTVTVTVEGDGPSAGAVRRRVVAGCTRSLDRR